MVLSKLCPIGRRAKGHLFTSLFFFNFNSLAFKFYLFQLIAKTTFIRSQCALKSALEFLNKHSPTFPTVYNPSEPSISLQILHPQPVDQSESLKLTVQSKTGMFVVTCPKLSVQTCSELESAINKELPTYKLRLRKKQNIDC